jgi:hypothetical protein
VEESGAMKLTVKPVPQAKQTSVRSTAEESGVMNPSAIPVPKAGPTNALHMAVVPVVLIALIGLIVVAVRFNTTAIVQHASNDAFLPMHAVKLSILIQKKLW